MYTEALQCAPRCTVHHQACGCRIEYQVVWTGARLGGKRLSEGYTPILARTGVSTTIVTVAEPAPDTKLALTLTTLCPDCTGTAPATCGHACHNLQCG